VNRKVIDIAKGQAAKSKTASTSREDIYQVSRQIAPVDLYFLQSNGSHLKYQLAALLKSHKFSLSDKDLPKSMACIVMAGTALGAAIGFATFNMPVFIAWLCIGALSGSAVAAYKYGYSLYHDLSAYFATRAMFTKSVAAAFKAMEDYKSDVIVEELANAIYQAARPASVYTVVTSEEISHIEEVIPNGPDAQYDSPRQIKVIDSPEESVEKHHYAVEVLYLLKDIEESLGKPIADRVFARLMQLNPRLAELLKP
jgi:hypothetical protein